MDMNILTQVLVLIMNIYRCIHMYVYIRSEELPFCSKSIPTYGELLQIKWEQVVKVFHYEFSNLVPYSISLNFAHFQLIYNISTPSSLPYSSWLRSEVSAAYRGAAVGTGASTLSTTRAGRTAGVVAECIVLPLRAWSLRAHTQRISQQAGGESQQFLQGTGQ